MKDTGARKAPNNRVQATACNRMSNQLRGFFTGTGDPAAGTQ